MSGSVNKVIIIGNLGKDPEVRSMQSGGKVCSMSVASSESWKDKQSGERKERTEWHRVVIFNEALISVAERFLKKGSKVYLEGQIETRKWSDQSGSEKFSTEIVLRPFRGELTLLDARESGGEQRQQSGGYGSGGGYGAGKTAMPQGASGHFDDEIPF